MNWLCEDKSYGLNVGAQNIAITGDSGTILAKFQAQDWHITDLCA